jgi:hypothetical protein
MCARGEKLMIASPICRRTQFSREHKQVGVDQRHVETRMQHQIGECDHGHLANVQVDRANERGDKLWAGGGGCEERGYEECGVKK